ncbi:efflux transporter outer membrane subunit [Paraburkholderia atlantica]|uniref:RND efflux system, outer membrane lipoprotein, NodT family n=1 Tax=Paraburkholderia atlantica TaxID=2654982 RepID=D5WFI8_PARAM|nr:efflux transporter outer membrane subunit [Paraburkholderia atlantica]ADG19342.1 RND efflux system, outer membrane lipoprotein, NodT family [Paraburkholderia atlantica]MBB5508059.1 NodT family efflux transporter outer membrane factor (OMF) lipoprotein [Paraburkholderia atlantica]
MFDSPLTSLRRIVAACTVASLAACTTLPHYHAPSVEVPAHFATPSATSGWTVASPADAYPRGAWWTLFGDSELDALEARVDVSNQTVREAVANLQAARAMIDYQRAGYAPTVTAGVAAQRYRTSQNLVDHSLAGKTMPDYSTGVAASWEPDLFGRVKDATLEAHANAQASAADLESVRLSVATQLAADYFALRTLDREKRLLDDTVTAYAAALRIVQQQLADGAIDASAVAQAQTQLESARTADSDVDVQRAQRQHAIATLIGVPASSFALPAQVEPVVVPSIPAGVPSALLERRPDIAAAERRVAAANARIGEAHAAFYPDLTLSASAGLESTFFAPWLTAPSLFWSLGSQLAGTIFDGGRRNATLKGANAQYDAAVAGYRQTVLTAFQQVEDNLSALNTLANEAQSQQRATAAAQLSLKLTTNRYQAGAVNYLDVVTAQTIALANERNEEQIAGRRLDASVHLLEALGGGWDRASLANLGTKAMAAQTSK